MATQSPRGGNGMGRLFAVIVVLGLFGLSVMCVLGVRSAIDWARTARAQDWIGPVAVIMIGVVMVAFVLSQTIFKNQLDEARKDLSLGDLVRGCFSLIWRLIVAAFGGIVGGGMTFVITSLTSRLARQDALLILPNTWITPEQAAFLGTIVFFFLVLWRSGQSDGGKSDKKKG